MSAFAVSENRKKAPEEEALSAISWSAGIKKFLGGGAWSSFAGVGLWNRLEAGFGGFDR